MGFFKHLFKTYKIVEINRYSLDGVKTHYQIKKRVWLCFWAWMVDPLKTKEEKHGVKEFPRKFESLVEADNYVKKLHEAVLRAKAKKTKRKTIKSY